MNTHTEQTPRRLATPSEDLLPHDQRSAQPSTADRTPLVGFNRLLASEITDGVEATG